MRLHAAHQLFLSYLVLIALVVASLSAATDSILRGHLTATARADLERELRLGRALYESRPDLAPDSVVTLLSALSGRRVTIVAADGRVLGDSHVAAADLPRVENHGDRPEIRSALRGELGYDTRRSGTVGVEHIYLAMPSARGDVVRFAVPTAELDAALAGMQRAIFSVGAVALLLAALFSFGFSYLITRPLRAIGEVARGMTRGDLSRRVRLERADELGDLGNALDALADELQRRLGQLENERAEMQALIDSMSEAVLALGPDGTVRRANPAAARIFSLPPSIRGLTPEAVARRPDFLALVQRALRGEPVSPTELRYGARTLLASAHPLAAGGAVLVFLDVSELRRLEDVRRDFVANASHELKTPLTAIRGYSETLLENDLPPDLRRQFAETVKANADRLQRIVDDLLDLSRLESGRWRVQPEPLMLEEVAREVWATVAPAAGGKPIDFSVSVEEACRQVLADPAGLRQILSNLLSNACRYTPAGGEISVRARCLPPRSAAAGVAAGEERGEVEIAVRDTGAGIPAQHLGRIFERFYRVDPARSRQEGGTGLGLAIVKHLVEAHGGRVSAESELGRGTTIRFTLPAAALSVEQQPSS